MKPLYLDVKDISSLVRPPTVEGERLIGALQGGEFALVFTLIHLQELSHPTFRSMGAVGKVLDSVSLLWGIHIDELWDLECKRVLSSGPLRRLPKEKVFYPDAAVGWSMPLNAQIPPSQMLTELSARPAIRKHFEGLAAYDIVRRKQFGTAAAVVADLRRPAVARLLEKTREWGRPVSEPTARSLVSEGGMELCMPSYLAYSLLSRSRSADASYPLDANDTLDELHAAYAPYVEAAVLDRRTAGRYRSLKCPGHERVFRNIPELVKALNC